jgi:hypothetical protein
MVLAQPHEDAARPPQSEHGRRKGRWVVEGGDSETPRLMFEVVLAEGQRQHEGRIEVEAINTAAGGMVEVISATAREHAAIRYAEVLMVSRVATEWAAIHHAATALLAETPPGAWPLR